MVNLTAVKMNLAWLLAFQVSDRRLRVILLCKANRTFWSNETPHCERNPISYVRFSRVAEGSLTTCDLRHRAMQ